MIKINLFYTIKVLIALILLCNTSYAEKITVTGSSTIAPLLSEIAKQFENDNTDIKVDIQTGGSSRGIADTNKGISDIGMSSRALFPQEKINLKTHTLALDGVAFIVNSANKVNKIDKKIAIDIYNKKITNWKELGGSDKEIVVISRSKSRSELKLVSKFLGLKNLKADIVAGENQHLIKLIEGNKDAIGYVSVGETEHEILNGKEIRALSINDIQANSENVKNGSYPLIRPLILITKQEPEEKVKKFLTHALSKKVNNLVTSLSFVPTK